MRKLLSVLLTVAMVLSLLPALPAAAVAGDVVAKPTMYKSIEEFKANSDASGGLAVIYNEPNTGTNQNGNNIVRVDYAIYKMPATTGYQFNLKYDAGSVSLMSSDFSKKLSKVVMSSGAPKNPGRTAIPGAYVDEIINMEDTTNVGDAQAGCFFDNAIAGYEGNNLAVLDTPTITIGNDGTSFTGTYEIILTKTTINATMESALKIAKQGGNNGEFDFSGIENPVVLCSTFFEANDINAINENTFGLIENDLSETGAVAMYTPSVGDQQFFKKVAMVGFSEPEATKYNVKFNVLPKAGATSYLKNPKISFTNNDTGKRYPSDDTNTFYSASSENGLLTLNATIVNDGGGEGTLNLPAGSYSYTVTPTDAADMNLYLENKDTFSFTGADNISLYAKEKPVDAKDYTIKILDGESANDDIGLANVEVTLDGAKKTTDQNGEVSFNKIPGDYTMSVKLGNYIVHNADATTGNGITFGSDGTISGGGISTNNGVTGVVLNQKRTKVSIEAKDNTTALNKAIITIRANEAAGANGVTPNMASNELPKVISTNASGLSDFDLPNGFYTYTIEAAGYETVGPVALSVQGSIVTIGGTVSTGSVTGGTDLPTSAVGETGYQVKVPITATADPNGGNSQVKPINDPLYYVVGTWNNNEVSPTTMTVEVYLKNVMANKGTFGLKYDTNVFETIVNASDFVKSSDISIEPKMPFSVVDGKPGVELLNPSAEAGYHTFVWTKAGSAAFDTVSGAKLLGTYTLKVKSGVNVADMVHSKSLYVQPYTKTVANTQIYNEYVNNGVDLSFYHEFISDYWRKADEQNNNPAANSGRLDAKYAMDGGFQQVIPDSEGTVSANDVRTQFVFNSFGNIGATFNVLQGPSNNPGNAIADATVTVKKGDSVIRTGTTDKYGQVVVGIPQNENYTYTVDSSGYKSVPGDLAVSTDDVVTMVYMLTDTTHDVLIHDSDKGSVELLGANKAQNSVDYYFNLSPKAGYQWKAGKPAPSKLTITLGEEGSTPGDNVIPAENITFDSKKNSYRIDGVKIIGDSADKIVINIADDAATEQTTQYVVKVTAGTGGKFSYTPEADAGSTFLPDTPETDIDTVTETLAVGKTTSATYHIKTNGAVNPSDDLTKPYQAYVIDKFIVNGSEINLTDPQRIHGFDYQLKGILADQNISITYAKAMVNPKLPGDDDDLIVPDDPTHPYEPIDNAIVSVIMGEYGSALVSTTGTDTVVNGSSVAAKERNDFSVADDGTFQAVITPMIDVTLPGGTPLSYQIDKVYVDGEEATASFTTTSGLTGTWAITDPDPLTFNAGKAGTLNITAGFAKGGNHTVVVTFKPAVDGAVSIEAAVNATVTKGDGIIQPAGMSIYTVGDMPVYTYIPGAEEKVGSVQMKAPGSEAVDLTKQLSANTVKLPALKSGTTLLSNGFDEISYTVRMKVDYRSGGTANIVPYTVANISFTRTSGGTPVTINFDTSGKIITQAIEDYEMNIPAGTWTVTVRKNGYLNYVVTGFTINEKGTAQNTYSDGSRIYFGQETQTSAIQKVTPIIGDATWDGRLISLVDMAQVANGMVSGASEARKERADIDESRKRSINPDIDLLTDISYVNNFYGRSFTTIAYTDFIKLGQIN